MSYDERLDFAEKRKYVEDLLEIAQLIDIDISHFRSLEVGGEGGVLAGLLGSRVAHVTTTDIINSQARYGGAMASLLAEKFKRNDEHFPLEKVEFVTADAQNLPFRDDWFDFCFSQNAFEHIGNPEQALKEAARVTRPGGYIYVVFDPLWTADSGSHFLHWIGEPWLHLLAEDEILAARMLANGADESEVKSFQNDMNRKPVTYFREMFPRVIGELGAKVLVCHEWSGCVDPAFVEHPNRQLAAKKLGVDPNDLLVRGIRYLIQT